MTLRRRILTAGALAAFTSLSCPMFAVADDILLQIAVEGQQQIILAGAGTATMASPAAGAAAVRIPPKLTKYVELAEHAERYREQLNVLSWQTVYREDFKPKDDPPDWFVCDVANPKVRAAPQVAKVAARYARDGDNDVLIFDTQKLGAGLLAVGPPLRGDYSIEFLGKVTSQRVCDLSIVCNGFGQGPAFQFGANDNVRNLLWAGLPGQPQQAQQQGAVLMGGGNPAAQVFPQMIAAQPLIERNRWHRVRLDVIDGEIMAHVDGQMLARRPVGSRHDRKAPMQPYIYVHESVAAIDHVTIRRLAPDEAKIDRAAAWELAFGTGSDSTPQAVRTRTVELVAALADEDAAVREAAQTLLARMGEVAKEPLKEVAINGSPEQVRRARRLLARMD